jgi:hypothetical protein
VTIHKTRSLIVEVLETYAIDARTRSLLQKALDESWRAVPVRQAPRLHMQISENTKAQVRALALSTDMTMGQIAERVGLRNQGRVSEILSGKRK